MRTVLVITSAALALAACQKSPGASASGAAPAPAAGPAPASTGGLPQRRSGLWQQTISREGAQGALAAMSAMGGMKICVDASAEPRTAMFGHNLATGKMGTSHCSPPATSRGLDGGYSFTTSCAMGEAGTITTKGTASGNFSDAYHVHVETDVSGARYAPMNGHHVTDIDGKWLGPCPAGMSPGDVELANGMKINAGKFAGAARAMGGGR